MERYRLLSRLKGQKLCISGARLRELIDGPASFSGPLELALSPSSLCWKSIACESPLKILLFNCYPVCLGPFLEWLFFIWRFSCRLFDLQLEVLNEELKAQFTSKALILHFTFKWELLSPLVLKGEGWLLAPGGSILDAKNGCTLHCTWIERTC